MKREEKIPHLAGFRRKDRWSRTVALTLAFTLLLPSSGLALAGGAASAESGTCEHHPQHTEACGYAAPSEGSPCTHVHGDDCGYAAPTEGSPCTHMHDGDCGYAAPTEGAPCSHVHDENCGYVEAVEGTACDKGCTTTDASGGLIHSPDCAYTPAVAGVPCNHTHDETCGYTAPSEGSPCTHVHDDDCGYAAPTEGSPCNHVHDESCGYAAPAEGAPCGFVCDLCVTGWQWDDPEGLLVWNEEAAVWGLALPGAGEEEPVTREALAALLPQAVTAATAAGEQRVELTWDLDGFPEAGAWQGQYTLTAALAAAPDGEAYVLTDSAPALSVLADLGGGETLEDTRGHHPGPVPQVAVPTGNVNPTHKFVNGWSYVDPTNAITHTTEYDYSMEVHLNLSSYTDTNEDALINAIKAVLPEKIYCNGTFWNGDYSSFTNAGLEFEKTEGNQIYGKVGISWDFSKAGLDNMVFPVADGTELQLYADPVSNPNYLLRVNTNDYDSNTKEGYKDTGGDAADTAEAYDILNLKVTLKQTKTSWPGPVQNVPANQDGKTHKFVSNWEYVLPGGVTGLRAYPKIEGNVVP